MQQCFNPFICNALQKWVWFQSLIFYTKIVDISSPIRQNAIVIVLTKLLCDFNMVDEH